MKRRTANKIVRNLLQGKNRWRSATVAKAVHIANNESRREFYRCIKRGFAVWNEKGVVYYGMLYGGTWQAMARPVHESNPMQLGSRTFFYGELQ